ncbi:MAG TPA: fimbria/pilus periplasmic chaperone [Gammaproteobacteria bacterium]
MGTFILQRFSSIAAVAALFLLASTQAFAGAFRAMPLRLYLDSKSKSEVLRITNEGDEAVTVQIDTKTWAQDGNGQDVYGDTTEIVVFPKMATIEKGATQIVRIGFNGAPAGREQTYRLFVQELPVSKPGEMALKFALTMSLPVFVAPDQKVIDWSVEPGVLKQETLPVKVTNNGNHHVMISKIKAIGLDANGAELFTQEATGWYTLAGQSRTFPVNVPYQQCEVAARIRVEVQGAESSKTTELAVNRTMCSRKPPAASKTDKATPPKPRAQQ